MPNETREHIETGNERRIQIEKYRRNKKVISLKEQSTELLSKKHKRFSAVLNYTKHFLILVPAITGCVSISAFVSLVHISLGITSFAIESNICAITAGIKRYKSIIKKMKKRQDKILFFNKN